MLHRQRSSETHLLRFTVLIFLFLFFLMGSLQWRQAGQAQAVAMPGLQCYTFSFGLSGAEEVPPNGSPATGTGLVTIDTDTNQLDYNITFSGLQGMETAAHIHGFAPPGSNAGVLYTLPPGSPKIGSITYTEAQEADLLAGLSYVNIHSSVFGGGEIRGQIDDAMNCVTPTPTPPPCTPTAVDVTYNPLSISYSTGDSVKFFRVFIFNPSTGQMLTLFQTGLPACYENTINTAFNVPPEHYGCAFLYDPATQDLTLDCNPN